MATTKGHNHLTSIFVVAYLLSGIFVSAQEGYFFTMPKVLLEGDESEFCLTVYSSSTGDLRNVSISLINTEDPKIKVLIEDSYDHGVEQCSNFTVPRTNKYVLLLYNETDILHDSVEIMVRPKSTSQITLIQTDKPIYKPGQKVRFRILTIESNQKPRSGTISSVYVKDPNGSRVKQFLNIDSKGIASLEFQLSKEVRLGQWEIVVFLNETESSLLEDGMVSFEVKEYVLPRFEVTITPPSYILPIDEVIEGKVCAKYTYGKDLEGTLELNVCGVDNAGRSIGRGPCLHEVVKIKGCYNFTANASSLLSSFLFRGWHLKIDASVTESGTGSTISATHKGPSLSRKQLNMVLMDTTNGFFKPGFPIHGQVIVKLLDGQPAVGENILVSAKDYQTNMELTANYTSDEAGMVYFSFSGEIGGNTEELSLMAEAADYLDLDESLHLETPRAFGRLQQWFSPSLSYIQIPRTENKQKCGDNITISIPFTTRAGAEIEFKYQIVAKGKVVESGSYYYMPNAEVFNQGLDHSSDSSSDDRSPSDSTNLSPPDPDNLPPWDSAYPSPPEMEDDEDDFVPPMPPFPPPFNYEPPFDEPIVRSEDIADTMANFTLEIPISTVMAPKFTLVIHHVLPDGEIVADSMEFQVEPCFDNKVNMTFDQKTVLPGEKVNLQLEAEPGSVCGLGIVDKSVNILGGSHQITMDTIFQKIEDISTSLFDLSTPSFETDREYCQKRIKKFIVRDEWYWDISSKYVDALEAFKSSGLMVLTNLKLETRPCQISGIIMNDFIPRNSQGNEEMGNFIPAPLQPLPVAVPYSKNNVPSKPAKLRSHFPETWLWDLQLVGENGTLILPQEAPHTITSWIGNAMCINAEKGVGISPLQNLTTFQPFFIYVHLPYAAVRGERLPVIIKVQNYLDKCLHMKLSVDMGKAFKLHSALYLTEPFCVCPNNSFTARFYATALDIGSLPITAKAEIIPGTCKNSVDVDLTYVGLSDAVRRQVLVKAEGVAQEYTHSLYMCAHGNDRDHENVILPLPEGIVKDSERGDIKVIGDIMGPALTNLDNLVRLPTGCGEQNMVTFTPNIYVLKYLSNAGLLTEELRDNAVKYMEIGYQRELNYRHKDGSFSAFGENDERGSVWLTAFVVKSFAQAVPYIYIDPMDIEQSISFLKRSQLENGCFLETGKVFSSYMMGGLGNKRSPIALTSYVLIALLHANVNSSETVIVDGFMCIDNNLEYQEGRIDVYSLAVAAYAYTLYSPFSKSSLDIMKTLEKKSKREGLLKFWNRNGVTPPSSKSLYYNNAVSAEVEMTSYALLAYLIYYGEKAIPHTHPIAMWLSRQRNPLGGFASTQDTVVGLNALSEFALLGFENNPTNMNISVSGNSVDKVFQVSEEENTKLLVQTTPIKKVPVRLRIWAEGQGCALVQANVRYNKMPQNIGSNKPGFHLKVMTRRYRHDHYRCDRRTINIAVGSRSNRHYSKSMSLVIVKMVTSWTPIKDSLVKLQSQFPYLGIKRYEYDEIENVITFYFDVLERRPREFTLDLEQDREMKVSNPKAAQISVVNYYETDIAVVKSYTLKTTCGTKEEIPDPRVVPFDPNIPIPVQVRVNTGPLQSPPMPAPNGSSCTGSSCQTCPVCRKSKGIPSADFKDIICNASFVYKTISGRKGVSVLKIRQDLRPDQRVTINKFANYTLPDSCECSLLNPPVQRVFIITSSKLKGKMLNLNKQSVITYSTRKIERELLKLKKSCPSG